MTILDVSVWLGCAIVLLSYFVTHSLETKKSILLVGSLAGIFFLQSSFLWFLVPFTIATYWAGKYLNRRGSNHQTVGVLAILIVILTLCFFKYGIHAFKQLAETTGFSEYILTPIGISYYSFKTIHYLIESGRRTLPDHNFRDYLLYQTFLPIFFAGPIERFERFNATSNFNADRDSAIEGIERIVWGLGKKILIADLILKYSLQAQSLEPLVGHIEQLSLLSIWSGAFLFFLYCYFDFAAISDIAIGASRLFGLRICENFNRPLFSRSIGEFWQRWHMSLANFCRYYVYLYVLGATRNLFLAFLGTMIVMGLWHDISWNWAIWGCYHGTGLFVYVKIKSIVNKKGTGIFDHWIFSPIKVVATLVFVTLGYSLVGTSDISSAEQIFFAMIGV